MKFLKLLFSATFLILISQGCVDKDHFVDLNTGKTITVEKDSATGYMINSETGKPVMLYVNTTNDDTIYGKTGKVVNNAIIKTSDGRYTYWADGELNVTDHGGNGLKVEDDGDYKVKDGDYKKKVEKDGDVKIKDGDTKIKIEDGEKKVKRN